MSQLSLLISSQPEAYESSVERVELLYVVVADVDKAPMFIH